MAKTKNTENQLDDTKLQMVPADNTSLYMQAAELEKEMATAERLNLPQMVDLKKMPVGMTVHGAVVKLVENFTGKKDMRKARLIQCKNRNGTEFLLPLTGVIKNAVKQFLIPSAELREQAEARAKAEFKGDAAGLKKELAEIELLDFYTLSPDFVGKTIFVTRQPDGTSKKYGDKPMFMFDVRLGK